MFTELHTLPAVAGLGAALTAARPHRKGQVGGFFEATNFPFFHTLASQGVEVRFGENDPKPSNGYPTLGYDLRDRWEEGVVNYDGLFSIRGTAGLSAKSRMSGPFNRNEIVAELSNQADRVDDFDLVCTLVSAGGRLTPEAITQAARRVRRRSEVSLLVFPLVAGTEKMLREDPSLQWDDLIDFDMVELVETLATRHGIKDRLGVLVDEDSRLRLAQHLADRLA